MEPSGELRTLLYKYDRKHARGSLLYLVYCKLKALNTNTTINNRLLAVSQLAAPLPCIEMLNFASYCLIMRRILTFAVFLCKVYSNENDNLPRYTNSYDTTVARESWSLSNEPNLTHEMENMSTILMKL